jgi:hypothetical protein
MDEFVIVGKTQLGTPVYMSELSARTLHDNGFEAPTGGLYLYEASDDPAVNGIRVLASVADTEAAYRLLDLMGGEAA